MSHRLALAGASIAVTGGARGIGRATAAHLAGAGARVAIGDIDRAAALAAAGELGAGVAALEVDVADPESVERFVGAAGSAHGPLDALVANAGLLPLGPFLEVDPELHRRAVEVNVGGVINCLHAALPRMIERGRGRVVIVASLMGRLTAPGTAVYSATKAAVVSMAEGVRLELRGTGVEVVTVLPTMVRTEAAAGIREGRGLPVVDAAEVASAIAGACERGGAEISVPGWAGPLARAGGAMPPGLMRPILWALGGDRAHHGLDRVERAVYSARIASGAGGEPPSSKRS